MTEQEAEDQEPDTLRKESELPMTRQEWIRFHLMRAPDATEEQWRDTLSVLAGIPRFLRREPPQQTGPQTSGA